MTSRDEILSKVRTSLGAKAIDTRRRAAADQRLETPPRHLVPQRARKDHAGLVAQFIEFLTMQFTVPIVVATAADVPGAVAQYLRSANLPLSLRMGSDASLTALPWSREPGLSVLQGPADPADTAGLSMALAAVSETGTLVLASGAHNPVTLAFVPETHLVVVDEATIFGCYEDAIERVRAIFGKSGMPRTLNLVSGASRTADIGGKIVIGAHGPRRLAVIIVKTWGST